MALVLCAYLGLSIRASSQIEYWLIYHFTAEFSTKVLPTRSEFITKAMQKLHMTSDILIAVFS